MKLNLSQIIFICRTISCWNIMWIDCIVGNYDSGTHRLGIATDQLKEILFPERPSEFFNENEVDEICYIIGEWYLKWKKDFVDRKNKINNFELAITDLINTLFNPENL